MWHQRVDLRGSGILGVRSRHADTEVPPHPHRRAKVNDRTPLLRVGRGERSGLRVLLERDRLRKRRRGHPVAAGDGSGDATVRRALRLHGRRRAIRTRERGNCRDPSSEPGASQTSTVPLSLRSLMLRIVKTRNERRGETERRNRLPRARAGLRDNPAAAGPAAAPAPVRNRTCRAGCWPRRRDWSALSAYAASR